MPDTDSDIFSISNGVLTCPYDMNAVAPNELNEWCKKLLQAPQSMLSIDMSSTRHIASHHLGIIAQAWSQAVGQEKKLVVKISRELKRVFEMSGLDQIFDLAEN